LYQGSTEHRALPQSSYFDDPASDEIQEIRESYGVAALREWDGKGRRCKAVFKSFNGNYLERVAAHPAAGRDAHRGD
jgi:hypothetical protein